MRILLITEKDAANASLSKIADSFIEKGHDVEIFAIFYSNNVLRFFSEKIPIHKYDELTQENAESFDCIFTSCVAAVYLQNGPVLALHKPIFTQNYLINKQLSWRGDVCFVPSLPTSTTDYDEYMQGSKIAIGEPKYDRNSDIIEDNKKLLFIDSGHYPFGTKGKYELAKTLLQICDIYPDYQLIIKPRFLPQDKVVTHRNNLHIYDVICELMGEDIRDNLVMLKEHYDLMALIDKCHTVICMHTTAFVGACISGKGLIVLDNLPSDDIYDTRLKTSYRIRDFIIPSGALVDYRSATKLLPHGVTVNEKYIDFLLSERENSAKKIVDCTIALCEKYYMRNEFPIQVNCDYRNVESMLRKRENWRWEDEIKLRYKDFLFHRMIIHIDFHLKNKIDISKAWDELNETIETSDIIQANFSLLVKKAYRLRNRCIAENREALMTDQVDQGILLNALYLMGYYEDIKSFPTKDIGAYYYYNALVANKEKSYELCVQHLLHYDKVSFDRGYIKEISDMPNNKLKAYMLLLKLLIKQGQMEKAKEILIKTEKIYCNMYNLDEFSKKTESKEQYKNYIYIKWIGCSIKNKFNHILYQNKYFVYGAGDICKRTLLEDSGMKNNIVAIIDQFCDTKEICEIPVIRLNMLECYQETNIVIVTLPYMYGEIQKDILQEAPQMKVYSIEQLLF